VERFQWFAALALLALTAEFLLGERVTSRVLHVTFYFLLFTACAPDVVRHNNAGNARFAEGAYDEASIEYRQAQVNEPDWPQPYYNAANAYNRQGQIDATLAQAQQALKTADPDLAAKTWYNLGNAYFDVQQWPDAISAYQEALRINPDDLDAKYNLELAQQQQEQSQENQESESSEQAESGAATPTPSSTAEAAADEEQTTPEADSQATAGMTPEQALQLLQALIGESETLQERLQESYRVPRPPSEKDW
jgi:Ca-activated chloride channel family protein